MDNTEASSDSALDLLIIGAGIGGVIALHYARTAGLSALVLERQSVVGGLWAELPSWQDIQFGRIDWTLGDLPIAGEDQASIRDNIQAWVERFNLSDGIRLNTEVKRARREDGVWLVETATGTHRARHLLAATGAHNRPSVPGPQRDGVALQEFHSSALRDPGELSGRDVVVVGGGASAYDLLDLCFEHQARQVTWVYRNTRWMVPTSQPKSIAGSVRGLAKSQMEGATVEQISRALNEDLIHRYEKFGLQAIRPSEPLDLRRHQMVPGRWRMIANFAHIHRHQGEVASITGRRVTLSTGAVLNADVMLWGTGYEIDLGFFDNPALSGISRHDELAAQCGCGIRALAEPNLYFLAPALESTGTAPWVYALMARTLMAHIRGRASLEPVPLPHKINHFHNLAFLAERDPESFPPGQWQAHYLRLATAYPADQPLPVPD